MDEFLEDKSSMMEFRGCWQDGQAGVSWLTGTHIADWVHKGAEANRDPDTQERKFFDFENQLTEAADKIDKMFWFGILEDYERSLELLAYQLDKPLKNFKRLQQKIGRQNLHKLEPSLPSEESTEFLKNLMPQDIWLYEYAKTVFQARWNYYKTRIYQHPKRPAFPKIPCQSTRFILKCSGTDNDFIFKWDEKMPEEHAKNFNDLLQ
ncbi:Oidioi.mRNA.OKI2018_I69.chr2.g7481.t1.cds [Oikopleura dioica]|uniref:Oidioi.mRNA.OKI2018_I69.chr2.g7481.t1.cds n=1 Tax=Oikopleura dioica TaxID=34765 RepID=A0ABN7T8N4_OIKDI|nr:Oidioi.mRNA.OKI2018_I69.chr2.g7481.t1.cds [Oikopleura dioica]